MIKNNQLFESSASLLRRRWDKLFYQIRTNQQYSPENDGTAHKERSLTKISTVLLSLLSSTAITLSSATYIMTTPSDAIAAAKKFTITVQAGKNGSVSPKAKKSVTSGAKATYKVTPGKQYLIESLTVNGAPKRNLPSKKGQGYTLTIPRVSENLRIVASFAQARTVAPLSLGSQISVVDPK